MKYLLLLEKNKLKIGNTLGIDNNQVVGIEKKFQLKLPSSYKEYLMNFGTNSGNLLASYYMTYPSLVENKADAIEMLNFDDRKLDSEKPTIKDSYFFFGQWQGYVFYFFDCSEDTDDPAVYILTDSPKIEKYKNSFSEFIYDEGLKPLLELQSPL
jgi:hypothetical protein